MVNTTKIARDSCISKSDDNKTIYKTYNDINSKMTAITEISFLNYINHPNIIKFKDAKIDKNNNIVVELPRYPMDLRSFISDNIKRPIEYTIQITLDVINSINYLSHINIIHGDIKPGNILISERGNNLIPTNGKNKLNAVLCDLGISRHRINKYSNVDTAYISTETYRAPEILISEFLCSYDFSIDLWSVGCIMIELITNQFVLKFDHLESVCELFIVDKSELKNLSRDYMKKMLNFYIKKFNILHWPELIYNWYLDLIVDCLSFNPSDRLSALTAPQTLKNIANANPGIINLDLLDIDIDIQYDTNYISNTSIPKYIDLDMFKVNYRYKIEIDDLHISGSEMFIAEKIYNKFIKFDREDRQNISKPTLICMNMATGLYGVNAMGFLKLILVDIADIDTIQLNTFRLLKLFNYRIL